MSNEWEWYGQAAHLIVGHWCRFHMATLLPNGYMVSTAGEYWPERGSREIHASVHDSAWLEKNRYRKGDDFDAHYFNRFGYQEIGCGRKYETYVFHASGAECECGCGLPKIDFSELDFLPANDAKTARASHMELCHKWATKEVYVEQAQ